MARSAPHANNDFCTRTAKHSQEVGTARGTAIQLESRHIGRSQQTRIIRDCCLQKELGVAKSKSTYVNANDPTICRKLSPQLAHVGFTCYPTANVCLHHVVLQVSITG